MYLILNAFAFIFLSAYAFRLMLSKPSYFKLSSTEHVILNGREKFLLFTLVTGMFAVGPFSSLRLIVWIVIMLSAFIFYRKYPKINKINIFYLFFLLWLAITIVWSPSIEYAIRVYLKYFYPLVALFFAATFVNSDKFIFIAMKWLLISSFIYSILLGGIMTQILGIWTFYFGGLFWPISTLADHLSIMSAISFVMWWRTKEKKYLYLIIWFLVSTLIQGVRTGLLSIGLMLMVGSYIKYRIYSLPYLVGAIVSAVTTILYIPVIKEKMFFNPENVQNISDIIRAYDDGSINTSARSSMWEYMLNKFYYTNEIIGSGLGSVQQYMYENYLFGGLQVVHSDYVQLLCDTGYIGLFLYLLFPTTIYVFLSRYTKKCDNHLNTSAILAILTYAATLPAMGFDNVVNYSLPAHTYTFIFLGIFLAYRTQNKKQRR
jgi:hypothetical protein